MRMLRKFGLLLMFMLTFGLLCSEIPESFSLCDDTSNDFVESACAREPGTVIAPLQEATPRQDTAAAAKFSALPLCYTEQPVHTSGSDLLQLLATQRK